MHASHGGLLSHTERRLVRPDLVQQVGLPFRAASARVGWGKDARDSDRGCLECARGDCCRRRCEAGGAGLRTLSRQGAEWAPGGAIRKRPANRGKADVSRLLSRFGGAGNRKYGRPGMNKFVLLGAGLAVLVSTASGAEPSHRYATLAQAVRAVKANCGDLHDPNSTSFLYPPKQKITLAQCRGLRGNLCWAVDHAMGGRWSRELICSHGSLSLGGFPSTYVQGRTR